MLGNNLNPLSDPQYADSVLRSLRGPNDEHREDADIVLQTQFGVCHPIPSVCSVYADDNLHIGPRHRTRTLCERRDIRLPPQWHGESASDESVAHPYQVSLNSLRCLDACTPPLLRKWPRRRRACGTSLQTHAFGSLSASTVIPSPVHLEGFWPTAPDWTPDEQRTPYSILRYDLKLHPSPASSAAVR